MDGNSKGYKGAITKITGAKPPESYTFYTLTLATVSKPNIKTIVIYKIDKTKLVIRISEKNRNDVLRVYTFVNKGNYIANVNEFCKENNSYWLTNYLIYHDKNKKNKKIKVKKNENNKQQNKDFQSYFKKFDDWQQKQIKNANSESSD